MRCWQIERCSHDSWTWLAGFAELNSSRAFDDRPDYEAFVDLIAQRFNARATKRLAVERPMLKSLPTRRTAEYEELPARVSKYAIFTVKGAQYSAPSQLIGHRLMVRQYAQHIECWLGGRCVLERRPRRKCLKREGKSVNLSSATVPRLRKARPGGACSQMESEPNRGRLHRAAWRTCRGP